MKPERILLAVWLLTKGASTSVTAGEGDNGFLRSVGTLSRSDAQLRTVVTTTAGTNAYPTVLVTWRAGAVTDSVSKPATQAGWFVFVERPSRVWIFDGAVLSVLERGEKSVSDSSSAEAFKSCPKPVRAALPEKVRKRYFE